MKRDTGSILVGALLILGGILFLLMNFGFLRNAGALVIAMLFGAGGLAFLGVFASNSRHWWAAFPAFALLGIAGLITLGVTVPNVAAVLGGSLFLGSLALGFLLVYITHPENWWAIIPGGVLLTLAVVALTAEVLGGTLGGAIFFLGLAATFGLVYVLPTPQGRQLWAAWPAGGCTVVGVLVLIGSTGLFDILWPVILILVGLFLIYRYLTHHGMKSSE